MKLSGVLHVWIHTHACFIPHHTAFVNLPFISGWLLILPFHGMLPPSHYRFQVIIKHAWMQHKQTAMYLPMASPWIVNYADQPTGSIHNSNQPGLDMKPQHRTNHPAQVTELATIFRNTRIIYCNLSKAVLLIIKHILRNQNSDTHKTQPWFHFFFWSRKLLVIKFDKSNIWENISTYDIHVCIVVKQVSQVAAQTKFIIHKDLINVQPTGTAASWLTGLISAANILSIW